MSNLTVKELRSIVTSHKKLKCPPISRMKKAELLSFIRGEGIRLPRMSRKERFGSLLPRAPRKKPAPKKKAVKKKKGKKVRRRRVRR